ncbi:MAG: hypothetical protein PHN44_00495 [Candidatus Marinimicrobia bacterium]|nr:hypothetical protein [Candidatus Neomarinimicrobiota bacterium]MDD5539065.1 hypothetical protein [Candidatus Neomarinimicrobiota bacterium]
MKPVGYLTATEGAITGDPGLFYNYIQGGNGIFVQAKNPLMGAIIPIAPVEIRGLAPVTEAVNLINGKVPRRLYDLAFSVFLAHPSEEHYLAITWRDGEYHIEYPPQSKNGGGVEYQRPKNIFMDIHSHSQMPAFFSGTDNRDETGFQLYLVIGKVDGNPEYRLRIGIYGYFKELNFEEVFDDCIISTMALPELLDPIQSSSPDAAERGRTSQKGLAGFFQDIFKSS